MSRPILLGYLSAHAAAECVFQPRGCPIHCGDIVYRDSDDRVVVLTQGGRVLAREEEAHPTLVSAAWNGAATFKPLAAGLTSDDIAFVQAASAPSDVGWCYYCGVTLRALARVKSAQHELAEATDALEAMRRNVGAFHNTVAHSAAGIEVARLVDGAFVPVAPLPRGVNVTPRAVFGDL